MEFLLKGKSLDFSIMSVIFHQTFISLHSYKSLSVRFLISMSSMAIFIKLTVVVHNRSYTTLILIVWKECPQN